MNLPNKLTVVAFRADGAFSVGAVLRRFRFNNTLALVFFCVAGVTDFLDGQHRAPPRSHHQLRHSDGPARGQNLDLLRRSLLLFSTGHLNLPQSGTPVKVAAWMVIIIVARELGRSPVSRLLAASKNVVLAAEKFGKHKTVSQIVAINALLVMDASNEWWPWLRGCASLRGWLMFAQIMLSVTVALTAASGFDLFYGATARFI